MKPQFLLPVRRKSYEAVATGLNVVFKV